MRVRQLKVHFGFLISVAAKQWFHKSLPRTSSILRQTSANFINQLDTQKKYSVNQIRSDTEHFRFKRNVHKCFHGEFEWRKEHLSAPSFPVNKPLHNFRNGIHARYWLHFNFVPEWKKCSERSIYFHIFLFHLLVFIYFCRVWGIRPQALNMRRLHQHTIMELKWN